MTDSTVCYYRKQMRHTFPADLSVSVDVTSVIHYPN